MAGVFHIAQQLFPFAFAITWFGVEAVLFFRFRAKQRAYLHRFPPVEGVPLDMYVGGGPKSVTRAGFRAMWRRQTDPELERLRREVWQHFIYMGIWVYGFPIIVFGAVVLLTATGYVH